MEDPWKTYGPIDQRAGHDVEGCRDSDQILMASEQGLMGNNETSEVKTPRHKEASK